MATQEPVDTEGRVGVVRDVSDRLERQRELEESQQRYRTLVEHFPNGAVALVDEDIRYATVGGTPIDVAEATVDDLVGAPLEEALTQELADILVPRYEAALDCEPGSFVEEPGGRTCEIRLLPVRDDDGDAFAVMGCLKTSPSASDTKSDSGRSSVRHATCSKPSPGIPSARSSSRRRVRRSISPGIVVYHYDVERDSLVPVDRSVDADFMREEFPEVSRHDGSITGHVYTSGGPHYYENVLESPHLQVSPDATEMRAGLFAPSGEAGIFVAGSRDVDGFDEDTRQLVELLATNASTAYDRISRERGRVHRQEQLEAMNSLNGVIREITDAVIDESTREEIERVACERLAATDSYAFAWIGDVDTPSQTVELRTEAGVEGYLDGITISVNPDDERSDGPTGRTLRTGEIQTTQDVQTDPGYEPRADHVEAYGFRSSAAIPIVHEGTTYGALNVYADRPDAFEGRERDLVSQLGEIIAHAIAAVERKQALTSDEVVELEFRISDLFDALGIDSGARGTITLENGVSITEREYLVYGHVTDDAVESLETITETVPHREETLYDEEGDTDFEVRLSEPPVLSVVASLGGSVEEATIRDGDYRMTIHLAPSADVRKVIDAVQDAYPTAKMVTRQQVTRSRNPEGDVNRVLPGMLTDRQQAALEAAYHVGFFEWTRNASGEDVAASPDIAPPTFHQHLRKGQRKVFESLLTT